MMNSKFRFLTLALLFPTAALMADDALRDRIGVLIRGLDAGTLGERSRAERQILDLGPDVLSKLPVLETMESVPARESLRRIRVQLERRAAKESSGPSKVTLTGRLSVVEILRKIHEQTGNRLEVAAHQVELREETLVVNWDQASFWDCLEDLRRHHDLEWDCSKDTAAIPIFRRTEASIRPRAVHVFGPFRVSIENVETRDVVGDSQQTLLRVTGRISAEPRLRPLSFSLASSELKAVLVGGQPLAPWNPDAKYELPVRDGGHDVLVTWDFVLSKTSVERCLAIRGKIRCQVAAAVERVVFDQTSLTRGTIRRRGGVSVRLRDVTFGSSGAENLDAEIGVAVSYDTGGPAFESHRTWIFHNAVYLETKSGARTSFTEFETAQQSDGAVSVEYRWRKIAPPASQYQFVYEAPTLVIDVPIEIDIGEILIGR